MESVEMKMAKIATSKWGGKNPTNIEEAKKITDGSEISSIKGIISVLGLNPELEQQMIDDIYTKETISEDIAKEIRNKTSDLKIIEILSVIHDEWVKNNPNKFMQPDRNREYQFVPLQMLSWKEAKSDLLFLKPILEAAGVRVDEERIGQQFEVVQKEFLIDKKIDSHDRLKFMLRQGSSFYPALKGVETQNGGNIEELLKKDEVLEKMADQVEGQIDIKSKEELAMDIICSENPAYREVYHVKTAENDFDWPDVDEYMSKKEMMLSKLIRKPHPSYVINGYIGRDYDRYKTEITEGGRDYGADAKSAHITTIIQSSRNNDEKIGVIEFEGGAVHITNKDLLAGGLDPEKMGWEEITKERVTEKKSEYKKVKNELDKLKKSGSLLDRYTIYRVEEEVKRAEQSAQSAKKDYEEYVVTPKAMARAAKKHKTTSSEIRGVKGFFDRVLGRDSKDKENVEDGKDEV